MIDIILGVIPLVLVVAFILLIFRSMDGRGSTVDRMKQAVGGTVMLLVALMVVFAFLGGGGDGPQPPDPPEPGESYDVHFYVASDSAGYGTVSISSLQDVPEGTAVTVAQTISVEGAGQCTATPAVDTAQYEYAFSHWTGADDSTTPAPASIDADAAYYAHFTRTEAAPTPMDPSLFTFTVADGVATVTGWAGTEPEAGYDLYFPDTDGNGHPVTAVYGNNSSTWVPPWTGAKSVRSDSLLKTGYNSFKDCSMESVSLPSATSIASHVFVGCTSLASVSLPLAMTIGTYAFSGCTSLASVSLPSATDIRVSAFSGCTAIESVAFGPIVSLSSPTPFPDWTFYDTDGTTVLDGTAADLANSTFQGVYNALIKVAPGAKSLSPQMQERALELAAENSLKASMLNGIDPELAGMDSSDVARMTVEQIRGLTSEDVQALKEAIQEAKSAEGGEVKH